MQFKKEANMFTLILQKLHRTQQSPHDMPRLSSICSMHYVHSSVLILRKFPIIQNVRREIFGNDLHAF